jgi:small-conductance mechanosensitive channel
VIGDAVETDSPIENQLKDLKDRGIEGIEYRFSFMKKVLPLFFFLVWLTLIVFPYLGQVPKVYISVMTTVLSVVAGVSLRPFLENLFSGIIISFSKSVKIGDTVIVDGHYGLIEEIGLTYSILKRWDWVMIVIPNNNLLQKEIENLTMNDKFIWAYIEFFVAPDTDMQSLEVSCIEVAKKSKFNNQSEEPTFWVMDMQKDAAKCWLAAWSDNPRDAWELRNTMRTELIKEMQRKKISFQRFNISRMTQEVTHEES